MQVLGKARSFSYPVLGCGIASMLFVAIPVPLGKVNTKEADSILETASFKVKRN
jgi:hypothetical protein